MLPATFLFIGFFSAAIAHPLGLPGRIARRRQSKPQHLLTDIGANDLPQVQYSSEAAGAVYDSYPSVSL